MSKKILLTTTALVLIAGLGASQAQSLKQDPPSSSTPSASTASPTTATPSGSSIQNQTTPSSSQAQSSQTKPTSTPSASTAQQTPSSTNTAQQNNNTNSAQQNNSSTQPSSNTAQSSPSGSNAAAPAARQNATTNPSSKDSNSAQNQTKPSTSSAQRANSPAANAPSRDEANRSNNRSNTSDAASNAQNRNSASVTLNEQQRSRIAASISAQRIAPATNVNFSISVGTRVPHSVQLHTVTADIVSIAPQYRGYRFFVTNNQVVIVEPRTEEIVTILPYGGGSERAQAAPARPAAKFTSTQRETIKKQIVARKPRTTISQTREITIGQDVPDTVVLEEIPETVYTEVPGARPYRYYRTDRNVVIVDPADRHVIDVLE